MVPTVFWGKLIASSLLEISHGLDPDHGSARGLISLRLRLVRTYSDTDPLKTGARELIDHQPGELNEKEIKKFIS
jgi:hypothetical protein